MKQKLQNQDLKLKMDESSSWLERLDALAELQPWEVYRHEKIENYLTSVGFAYRSEEWWNVVLTERFLSYRYNKTWNLLSSEEVIDELLTDPELIKQNAINSYHIHYGMGRQI